MCTLVSRDELIFLKHPYVAITSQASISRVQGIGYSSVSQYGIRETSEKMIDTRILSCYCPAAQ